MASSDDAQPDNAVPTPQSATRSVLAVHIAVRYAHAVGLGVGLVSRAACAKTGKTRQKVLKTQKQGFKFHGHKFKASRKRPGRRAALLGISEALALAKKTILTRGTTAPTNVAILLGRPWWYYGEDHQTYPQDQIFRVQGGDSCIGSRRQESTNSGYKESNQEVQEAMPRAPTTCGQHQRT